MKKMQPMTAEQMNRVLAAARSRSQRDFIMLSLASKHALRATEIARLRVSDINVKDGTIQIVRLKNSVTTTEKLQLESDMKTWLAAKPASPYLFPSKRRGDKPMSGAQIYNIFRRYAELANVPDTCRAPHAWRHTLGQRLADGGMDIKTLQLVMGHRNINSTSQYFTRPQSFVDAEKSRLLA